MSPSPEPSSSRVLVTGFEPFDRDTVNPSWEAARALDGWDCDGALVKAVQLPCVFGRAAERLGAALDEWRPGLVLGLGQATGRTEVSPERVAINIDDARIPDNAGRQPIDVPVVAGAPAAYFSTLPVKAMVHELRAAGVPAALSNSAGTFVCNHVFFALMHRLAAQKKQEGASATTVRGGFVHLPCLPEQAARAPGVPSMALAMQIEAVRLMLRTALAVREDVRESGGRLH